MCSASWNVIKIGQIDIGVRGWKENCGGRWEKRERYFGLDRAIRWEEGVGLGEGRCLWGGRVLGFCGEGRRFPGNPNIGQTQKLAQNTKKN